MKKYIFTVLGLFLLSLNCYSIEEPVPCKIKIPENIQKEYGFEYENVNLNVPGLKRNYSFIWISDLHVMADDVSEIEPKSMQAMT